VSKGIKDVAAGPLLLLCGGTKVYFVWCCPDDGPM
jgi:hypothetical protein